MVGKELKNNTIILTYGGSLSYGTSNKMSDIDIRGVAIEPRFTVFGLNTWEQFNSNKEEDIVIYGLKKFCRLAYNYNPNAIECLWTRDKDVLRINKMGSHLKEHRQIFNSKKCINSFEGFIYQCYKKSNKDIEQSKKLKTLMHMDRLLRMGTEFLLNGELNVYRENDKDLLLAIRNGELSDSDIEKNY